MLVVTRGSRIFPLVSCVTTFSVLSFTASDAKSYGGVFAMWSRAMRTFALRSARAGVEMLRGSGNGLVVLAAFTAMLSRAALPDNERVTTSCPARLRRTREIALWPIIIN